MDREANTRLTRGDVERFRELEARLLQAEVRRDPRRVGTLLTQDFCEFGSSGNVFSREAILAALAAESPGDAPTMEAFTAEAVGEGVVLVTYRSVHRDEAGRVKRAALRSSLWVLEEAVWRMRFHQGTPAA